MQEEEQGGLVHTCNDVFGRGEVGGALVVVAGDGFGEGGCGGCGVQVLW